VVYFVAINHHKKEIIINARGSFSLADVVTDLDAESIDLTAYGFVRLRLLVYIALFHCSLAIMLIVVSSYRH
jgi:hypothetical protein